MPRAIETASILAPALGGLEVRSECDFCEGHPGEADGLTWDELAERFPSPDGWNPDHSPVAGWETWREMGTRVQGALGSLVERHPGETVVVACHGGVVVQAMLHWLALDEAATRRRAWMDCENSSITEWRFASNPYQKHTLPVQLVRFNDHAHLATLA
jgi:broad specificity phosphatase PhoE